jgi:hypothetical protein
MYFEFDKKYDMACYLSLLYQAMENVFQKLDIVVEDEYASLPFTISLRKVEFPAKKLMINHQISLANQVLKNPKVNNAQHVPKIVELDDFDIEETEVTERQPLKRLKKTLLSPKAYEEENKQGNRIETHKKDCQTSPKKNRGRPLESKNNKKNLAANNVVQKHNVLKEREKLLEQHTKTFYV